MPDSATPRASCRSKVTHRSVILTVNRAAHASLGHRPTRPPWAVLRGRNRGVIAACCKEPSNVVLLTTAGSDDEVVIVSSGNTAFLHRGTEISAGEMVVALAGRDHVALVGRVDGAVAVMDPSRESALLALVPTPGGPGRAVAFLVALPAPWVGIAAHDDGRIQLLSGGAKSANSRAVWKPRIASTPSAIAVRVKENWEAVLADYEGNVRVINGAGEERAIPGTEFGNVLCAAWADGDDVVVGGEDDCLHRVNATGAHRERRTFGEGDDPDEAHCSFVTGVVKRGKCFATVGMDGRVIVWGEDGFGEVVLCREGESFYHLVWESDDVIYVSACVDAQGKCFLYRIRIPPKFAVKENCL